MFNVVKLSKNIDIDKFKYSGHSIGFDGHGYFSRPNGEFGCNVILFGVNMSSSVRVDKKKKDILILGEGPIQELDDTALATG